VEQSIATMTAATKKQQQASLQQQKYDEEAATKTAAAADAGCCGRLRAELQHPPFHHEEVNGQQLHGPESVGPSGTSILILKSIIFLWSLSVLIEGILITDPYVFYLAYLTHWSLIMTCLYFWTSWYHTLRNTLLGATESNVTFFHKWTWGLFALSAPAEIVVTVGYWGLEWDGTSAGFYYRNFMVHGCILLLLLLEGLVINRIPIRLRHFGLIFVYLILYLIWTVVHALLEIGVPGNEGDDDRIYTALQWKEDPLSTAQVAAQFLLILAPIAFLLVYGLSLYSFPCGCDGAHRRYVDKTNNDSSDAYVEMNTLRK
jgi:hypothetical protein